MKPYTLADAEADLRGAIDAGDEEAIGRLEPVVDQLDEHGPAPSILAAALYYAEQGLKVFTLRPGQKIPHAGTHGFEDATTDPDTIRAWWDRWPGSNVAIATGHLVDVVDIDGAKGQLSRVHTWDMFDRLDVIAKVSTPRPGGLHLYVPATQLGNKAGLLPGVDYRSTGGYVVAAPSRTPQGTYYFLTPLDVEAMKAAA